MSVNHRPTEGPPVTPGEEPGIECRDRRHANLRPCVELVRAMVVAREQAHSGGFSYQRQ